MAGFIIVKFDVIASMYANVNPPSSEIAIRTVATDFKLCIIVTGCGNLGVNLCRAPQNPSNFSHASPPGTAKVYSLGPTTSNYKDIAILVDFKSVGTPRKVQLMCVMVEIS